MNAQLCPVPLAVERPRYDNANAARGGIWIKDNYDRLHGYYVALGGRLPKAEDDNITGFARAQKFMSFCACQWDRERMGL